MYEDLVKQLREKPSKYKRDLFDEAADTIERQNAEIEHLKSNNRVLQHLLEKSWQRTDQLGELNETVKAEAIKEFAERVKEKIAEMVDIMWDSDMSKCRISGCHYPSNIPCGNERCIAENKEIWKADIDQIAKEMGVEL